MIEQIVTKGYKPEKVLAYCEELCKIPHGSGNEEEVAKYIEAFAKVYFSSDPQDKKAMGRMTSALLPVANRYNKKTVDERYQFRRQLRSLIKWYGYISQIVRMFDKDLHKEYVFCSYLAHLLPGDEVDVWDLGNKVTLEYYKLEETFTGSISLDKDVAGQYEPATMKKGAVQQGKKSPLEEAMDTETTVKNIKKCTTQIFNLIKVIG